MIKPHIGCRNQSVWGIKLVVTKVDEFKDGDELSGTIILDEKQLEYFKRLSPHLYALDTGKPRRASGNLKLPAPAMSTIANYLHGGHD